MSKYGFNENEVKKTIVTMIDKDGFHKETVYDGKYEASSAPADPSAFAVQGWCWTNSSNEPATHQMIAVNVPDGTRVNWIMSETDDDWSYNVGDTIDTVGLHGLNNSPKLTDINAAYGINTFEAGQAPGTAYYQFYLVKSATNEILARTKAQIVYEGK